MRKIIFLLLSIAWLLLIPSLVSACSCVLPPLGKTEKQLIELERKKSQAIFSGEVLEINIGTQPDGKPDFVGQVKFKVFDAWKGVDTEEVIVSTFVVCCACGYPFKVGESYLVYTYRSTSGGLGTSTCRRTKPLSEASEDIKVLGKSILKKSKT